MNVYEDLLKTISPKTKKEEHYFYIGEMTEKGCKIGKIELEKDDFYTLEYCKTGYFKNIDGEYPSIKNDSTFVKPLQVGDVVFIVKINPEKYIVVGRVM